MVGKCSVGKTLVANIDIFKVQYLQPVVSVPTALHTPEDIDTAPLIANSILLHISYKSPKVGLRISVPVGQSKLAGWVRRGGG